MKLNSLSESQSVSSPSSLVQSTKSIIGMSSDPTTAVPCITGAAICATTVALSITSGVGPPPPQKKYSKITAVTKATPFQCCFNHDSDPEGFLICSSVDYFINSH